MEGIGQVTFWLAYRLSYLVAKWRLAWAYWNEEGKPVLPLRWSQNHYD